MEKIICSAIWFKPKNNDGNDDYGNQPINIDVGFVTCGVRHSNCFKVISDRYSSVAEWKQYYYQEKQGFLTSENRFIDRVEAVEVALQSGQIKERKKELFSEDLW